MLPHDRSGYTRHMHVTGPLVVRLTFLALEPNATCVALAATGMAGWQDITADYRHDCDHHAGYHVCRHHSHTVTGITAFEKAPD